MAKQHYVIDSRKKAQIEPQTNGKINIIISDVVKFEENRETVIDYANFINGSEKTGKKENSFDFIEKIMYFISMILLMFLFVLLGFGKDFNILSSSYIDNIFGIVALLFGVASIPKVKEFIGKRFANKIWCILMILSLTFYIIVLMSWIGLSSSISNILGIIGLFICILTW